MRRSMQLPMALLVAAMACPLPAGAWGTLSAPLPLSDDERNTLQNTLAEYATNRAQYDREFTARLGPHPIHAFIAYKAFQLLERDPAYKDEKSGFPDIKDINAWDGIVRTGPGMAKRSAAVAGSSEWLDPPVGLYTGPGADAELSTGGDWNPDYNATFHYWNPWLECGGAPLGAGFHYLALREAIAKAEDDPSEPLEVRTGKHAHFMAHYISDVASVKHADAIEIPSGTMDKLEGFATAFHADSGDDINAAMNLPQVGQALALFRRVTTAQSAANSPKYWQRIARNITRSPVLNPAQSGMFITVAPPSLRSSVAAYLHELGGRPPAKSRDSFFRFYDPFYFNGTVLDTFGVTGTLNWKLATPFSSHVFWETNPAQFAFARAQDGKPVKALTGVGLKSLGGETSDADYQPFKGSSDFHDLDKKKRQTAIRAPLEELVKHCSLTVHGKASNMMSDQDFRPEFKKPMGVAIQHVFTGFRASITALRIDARLMESEVGGRTHIKCKLENLAAEPATLDAIYLSWDPPGYPIKYTGKGTKGIKGRKLSSGTPIEVGWDVEIPEDIPTPEFWVELCGHYTNTPDSGWRRTKVEPGLSVVYGTKGAKHRVEEGAPVDLIIVFDITGSMGSAIDSVRTRAISMIETLRTEKKVDLRLGLVGFRDHDDDAAPPFDPKPLTDNVDGLVRWMNDWAPKGGGDTPEDQYAALMRAIRMKWDNERGKKKVTKLIVVITDAPAKIDPATGRDFEGNNARKVADAAFKVDPAHIYPIIVGSNAEALAHGKELAELTGGRVLSAESGDQVAEMLLEAVEAGIQEHADTGERRGPGALIAGLLIAGLMALGVGLVFLRSRARAACPHCGVALRADVTFCPSCSGGLAPRRCPSPQCGQEMPADKQHCTSCGTPLT